MRIYVISAAVCCALFPLISVSAAGLSVEQRLAQLEARLNLAEQQASEASRRAQRAEQQTAAAEQRAAAAEQQVQALSQKTTAREQKQQATNQQLSEQLAKRVPDDGFTFNAYARSGMLV
ncbi:carbohydrate porin, partial [Klebsiella pneumoniae]